MFTGLSGNTWETAKIAHESHNDVRCLCWLNLGCKRSRDIHGLQLVVFNQGYIIIYIRYILDTKSVIPSVILLINNTKSTNMARFVLY